ncbi:MAG: SPOR domain-containing protein, partial [Candidatus Rokuibacteriota bacterium]
MLRRTMLTDHEARREYDLPHEGERAREHDPQLTFPVLEEPTWLEEDDPEEMEAPRDSAFRGIWIGIAAAAVTFALVFAVPHWLGWYEVGTPSQRAKRDVTPESVIATVTAKPSGHAVETPPVALPPAAAPPAVPPKSTATPAAAPPAAIQPAAIQKDAKPAAPVKRTFSVQIAAFKDAKSAKRLADRVKNDGYPADVRR